MRSPEKKSLGGTSSMDSSPTRLIEIRWCEYEVLRKDAARYRLARSHEFRLIDRRDEEKLDARLLERGNEHSPELRRTWIRTTKPCWSA
jgi:hypothetical protein